MSIKLQSRKRLSPQESRASAVAAARELLRDEGVAAVTLKSGLSVLQEVPTIRVLRDTQKYTFLVSRDMITKA